MTGRAPPDLRVMLYQGPSPAGDAERAFAALGRGLAAAAVAGARMAVFPELFLPGYNSDRIADLAQPADGDWTRRLSALAAETGCGATVGFAERAGGQVFNSAVAIGAAGEVLGTYRKIQLYGPREATVFAPGSDYCLFDLDGRRAALLICYDVEFAPHVRALAARGAGVILAPTANMHPFTHVARLTVPSQAVNHAVAIAYANYCGTEGDLDYCGGSCLVGADGALLAQAGPGEAFLIADIPAPDPALLSTQSRDFRAVD